MKMKIPSIFFNPGKQPWRPSCSHPKTLSFRSSNDHVFKTLNSLFLHASDSSSFTNSSSDDCTTTTTTDDCCDTAIVESILRDVRSSDRLFFETSSKLLLQKEEEESSREWVPFRESVALALESDDPYLDFKKSMQEMVESHGLEEWDRLEELLAWYLKMNAKHNHAFIVRAFVDLLLIKDSSLHSTSYSSAHSSFSDGRDR